MKPYERYTQDIKILINKNYSEKEIFDFMKDHPDEPQSISLRKHIIKTIIKNNKEN